MPNSNDYEFNDDITENPENEKRKPTKRLLLENKPVDKSVVKRHRKTRPLRDTNAPRMPLNGYVRYLNAHRDRAKAANPDMCFADITKLLASEWSSLAAEQKKQYLDEAEKAKEQYLKELQEYQRTEAYQEFQQKQKQIKEKLNKSQSNTKNNGITDHNTNAPNVTEDTEMLEQMETNPSTIDLPIFTEEFLDHNKMREQELRQLRKLNTEYEEQNAILSKHIDNMKSAISKLEVESVQQKNNNGALNQHLISLRSILSRSLAGIPIPGSSETPNIDNIDEYMLKLQTKLTKDKNRENEALLERVRTIVAGLDFSLI